MKINAEYLHDRRMLNRTGLSIERHILRREHEAAWVVWYVVLGLGLTLLMASCGRTAWAGEREVIASVIAAEACSEGKIG